MSSEIPWAWYLARSSALVAFLLLYISIFLGLSIRTPILKEIIKPAYSYRIHCWISLQALIFTAVHGIALLFDKFISFKIGNIFIPFYPMTQSQMAAMNPNFLALGVVAFYIMIILVFSSYFKSRIPASLWRGLHFLNIGLYIITIIHALYMGTDMKIEIVRNIFIAANAVLIILFAINLLSKLKSKSEAEVNNQQL